MPAKSKAAQRWAAGWEHNPGQMKGKRPDMTKTQLHDFAATSTKGLPERVKKKKK